MSGKAHLAMGVFIGGLIAYKYNLNVTEGAIVVSISSAASLLPDIDSPQSRIGRKTPILSRIISSTMGHRGFLHSLLFLALATLIVARLTDYWPAFTLGYAGHLIQDMCTVSGIQLFFPYKKDIRILPFKSGGIMDIPVTALLMALLMCITWSGYGLI